jgi:hypothetical protein
MTTPTLELSRLAEIHARELFGDENVNWAYCKAKGTFHHSDPLACEFILHIGEDAEADATMIAMDAFGCTPEFIDAFVMARATGAVRVLFYV